MHDKNALQNTKAAQFLKRILGGMDHGFHVDKPPVRHKSKRKDGSAYTKSPRAKRKAKNRKKSK